jgi:hypothetical protein
MVATGRSDIAGVAVHVVALYEEHLQHYMVCRPV